MTAALPSRRAFLIRYTDQADPGRGCVSGRVEHVDSGKSGRFASQQELNEIISRILREDAERDRSPLE